MKLPIASATKEGILSTGAQTISGDKTFTGSLIHAGGINRFSRADSTPTGTASTVFDDIVIGSVETTNTGITIFGSGQVGIAFGDAADSVQGQIRFQHSTNTMEFGTTSANPTMLRIDSNGRVGIGTAPVSGVVLAVHHSSDHSYIQARALSASYAGVVEARNSDNKTIGLIHYGSAAAGTLMGTTAANGSYLYSDSIAHLTIGTYISTPLVFSTNNAERMRIDSSGNVGIGVAPVSGLKLNVTGGIGRPSSEIFVNYSSADFCVNAGDTYLDASTPFAGEVFNLGPGLYIIVVQNELYRTNSIGTTYRGLQFQFGTTPSSTSTGSYPPAASSPIPSFSTQQSQYMTWSEVNHSNVSLYGNTSGYGYIQGTSPLVGTISVGSGQKGAILMQSFYTAGFIILNQSYPQYHVIQISRYDV
jgi:hypothetical protein